ncbi:MAG: hypothetical protein C4K60_17690 [Ideonella sp. MAG2]|nr:MAG: hypothetical protein C4K60_17690 [Ideonella sp. MAG2]
MTQRWKTDHDPAALAARLRDICDRPSIIKHCVEMVPWEVTKALAEASSRAGYRHLFLYRQRPAGRLLSLHFARQSGIWGPQGKTAKVLDAVYAKPLPVAELVAHEGRCAQRLRDSWELLLSLNQHPLALAFEDVYDNPDAASAQAGIEALLQALNLGEDPAFTAKFVADVLNKGKQGTRDDYARFQGVAQLERSLGRVAAFIPAPRLAQCEATQPGTASTWIRFSSLDAAGQLHPEHTPLSLGGLAVMSATAPPSAKLLLCQGPRETPVPWGFASQWAKQKFPNAPNGERARFAVKGVCLDEPADLVVTDPAAGARQSVLHLKARAATREAVLAAALKVATTPTETTAQTPDLILYGGLRRELNALIDDPQDLDALRASVLLDARYRQAATVAFERMTRLLQALEAQGPGASAPFLAQMRAVLGDLTLNAHGYTTALAGRDPVEVWQGIRALASRLEGLGLRWFINSGTLLGAIREQRLIAHDDDVDLAVVLEASTAEQAAGAWEALKRRLAEAKLLNVAFDQENKSHAKIGQAGGASVDLFPAWIEQGQVFVWPYAAGEAPVEALLPLQPLSICGVDVQVPNDPATLLTLNYGANWMQPDPGFRFPWKQARIRFTRFLAALKELSPLTSP